MPGTAKKDDRSFTIMVLPHSGEKAISFRLRISWLRAGAAVLTVALLTLSIFCVRYARMSISSTQYHSELNRLREENSSQKALLEDYEKDAAEAAARLDRLDALDKQIRELIDRESAVLSARSGGSRPAQQPREEKVAVAEVSRSGLGVRRQGLFTALIEEASIREQSLLSLKDGLASTIAFLRAKPSIMPTLGSITSPFGYRRSPVSKRSEFHEGMDIGAPYGAPVKASGDGVVTFSGYHGGLGRTVIIDHGYGIKTWYGHCYKLLVRQGEKVTRGRVIAYVGSSGLSTGPHLHYQVTVDGTYVDPREFLEVSEAQ
ncbi:MAG: M23 family metallopeptidase [Ignavibacteriales bacterium]